jgi:sodium/hydrogen antiporter
MLNCACFVYIGAWLPFNSFDMPQLGIRVWQLVILLVCVLFLRRIPVIMALYKFVPEIADWKEALFTGHFGPVRHN